MSTSTITTPRPSSSAGNDRRAVTHAAEPAGEVGFFAVDPRGTRWKRDNVVAFIAVHLVAALALVPYFFSWTGVVLLVAGIYVFGALGINLCFHRLLSHKSFECPRWLVRCLVVLGVCNVQDSPPHWVAVHRKHHHHTDDEHDPHSPLVSFFWAHMGWLLVRMESMDRKTLIARYARDIIEDPFMRLVRMAPPLGQGRARLVGGVFRRRLRLRPCFATGRSRKRCSSA